MNRPALVLTPPDRQPGQFWANFAESDLEPAKWVAIVTMAIDHYGKIVDDSVFFETHAIGRVSFPLFAAIIAIRLAMRPEREMRYLRYLIPWAIVSQPVFVLAGRDWLDGNIFFTLALGVAAILVWRRRAAMTDLSFAASIAAILLASLFVEFGPVGVAMIPATAWLVTRSGFAGLAAVGPMGLAANLRPLWPPLEVADLGALFASPILMASMAAKIRLPRLPTQFFYAFYPGHLLALHFYDLYG
jgi:hypothetical protein